MSKRSESDSDLSGRKRKVLLDQEDFKANRVFENTGFTFKTAIEEDLEIAE